MDWIAMDWIALINLVNLDPPTRIQHSPILPSEIAGDRAIVGPGD